MCEEFFNFFIDKIESVGANITVSSLLSIFSECLAVFNQFELVSLTSLREMMAKMRSSSVEWILFLFVFLNNLLKLLGRFFFIINSSVASGDVTKSFKHAAVEPVIKNRI